MLVPWEAWSPCNYIIRYYGNSADGAIWLVGYNNSGVQKPQRTGWCHKSWSTPQKILQANLWPLVQLWVVWWGNHGGTLSGHEQSSQTNISVTLLDNCNYKNYKSISWLQIDLEKSRAWIYLVCCPKSPSKRLMGSWLYTISTIQKDVKSVCLQACELLLPQSMGLVSPKLDVHNRQLPKSIPKVLVLGCPPWSI